jgi:hypothetical protein
MRFSRVVRIYLSSTSNMPLHYQFIAMSFVTFQYIKTLRNVPSTTAATRRIAHTFDWKTNITNRQTHIILKQARQSDDSIVCKLPARQKSLNVSTCKLSGLVLNRSRSSSLGWKCLVSPAPFTLGISGAKTCQFVNRSHFNHIVLICIYYY